MLDISLVIPTRNRADQLVDMLPHLERLRTGASWEIIIVDNASTDGTPEILARFAAQYANTTVLRQPKVGAAAARNMGWRAAAGRIVAFTDDDCYPSPDLLDAMLLCFSREEIGFIGGRVLRYDLTDAVVAVQPRKDRVDVAPRSFVAPGFIIGANMAFRRDILERLGGFDEKLGPGRLYGGEDDDVIARASALGIPGASDPGPLVFHHHRRSTPEQVSKLLNGYDFARGAFYFKMLSYRPTRGIYLWPALRRTGGNLWRREFVMMSRELRGAWRYLIG